MMSRKQRWLAAADAWWMTGNIWEHAGFPRKAEDRQMWLCLCQWAGMPLDK